MKNGFSLRRVGAFVVALVILPTGGYFASVEIWSTFSNPNTKGFFAGLGVLGVLGVLWVFVLRALREFGSYLFIKGGADD